MTERPYVIQNVLSMARNGMVGIFPIEFYQQIQQNWIFWNPIIGDEISRNWMQKFKQ